MEHVVWLEKLFDAMTGLGEEGRAAVAFLAVTRDEGRVREGRDRNAGALWTVFGNIRLNSALIAVYNTQLDDLRIRTLIVHEVRRLQQGLFAALSYVYGELDALAAGIWHLSPRAGQVTRIPPLRS
ncbi:MAG: hypothetical protein MZV49_25445 [Rhodopseudomonas palustris]|nr:hypothetical protein [Rhodopseudomonas palustris]